MGKLKFTSRIKQWRSTREDKLGVAMLALATDIHRVAVQNAPHDEGHLQGSGKVTKVDNTAYKVTFGDDRVPYARRRHFENKKNPQTLKYLERAGDSQSKNIEKYIERVI